MSNSTVVHPCWRIRTTTSRGGVPGLTGWRPVQTVPSGILMSLHPGRESEPSGEFSPKHASALRESCGVSDCGWALPVRGRGVREGVMKDVHGLLARQDEDL